MKKNDYLILVLLADQLALNLIESLLTHEGYDVHTVQTIEDARIKLEEYFPDLFILQYEYKNGGNGAEFIDELQKTHPEMQTLLLSATKVASSATAFMGQPFKSNERFIETAKSLLA